MLIIIIVILGIFCTLFLTGTISLNTNNKEATTESEQKEISKETEQKDTSTDESNEIIEKKLSYFEENKNLEYTDNLKEDINGKVAIIKMGEQVFQTEKNMQKLVTIIRHIQI